MTETLQVEIIKAEAMDAAAIALWRDWTATNPALSSPYFRWDYTEIAARVCPRAAVAVFRRGDRIVGFFPHQKRGGAVQPLGAPMNDYHGVIAAEDEVVALEDVARLLKARRLNVPGWIGAAEAGQARQTVQVAMPEPGFDVWYAERRKSFGKYFKDKERARRSLEAELGPVRIERGLRDPALLNHLIDLKAAQYRRSGLHDIFACGWTRELLHALMSDPRADFGASMAAMHAGDKLVAVEFSLHAGRHYHFWFPVYEPSLARCSPGILLSMDTMRLASAEGFRVFDFGFEGESYKKYFVNARQTVREAVVMRPGLTQTLGDAAVGLLNRGGGRGEALRASLRRRWSTIEACEASPVGRLRGAAVAVRSAAQKAAARKKGPTRVAHA
ncbi:GNAT family N-acetyltransferase [Brevundimonas sp.]|uniref:GNAT family N-acetyltransferase n=1 Tax=Brevundimonas sp. TaxID=1871086 RepID=UPI001794131E|nr:GNAT family N-acetyltransferase [Brevundimonas sp.]MBA4809237.1 GNAT family N-acetyltransferase [Brevundimonas sp.]